MTKSQIIKALKKMHFTGEELIANYGGNNIYYRQDKAKHDQAKRQALNILDRIKRIDQDKIAEIAKHTFMGRLEFNQNGYEYTAGQFYQLELPQAFAEVLSEYERQTN